MHETRIDPPWRCPHCTARGLRPCPHTPEGWRNEVAGAPATAPTMQPIDMVLHCPKCGLQHIDMPDADDEQTIHSPMVERWTNPPHRSHRCHGCQYVWRPADVPTNGVEAITTKGKNDSPAIEDAPCETEAQGFAMEAVWQILPELTIREDGRVLLTPTQLEKVMRHCADNRRMVITLRQAEELVKFFGGHDSEVTIAPHLPDAEKGLYAWVTEYPEEGSVYLGPTEVDDDLAENGRQQPPEARPERNNHPPRYVHRRTGGVYECLGEAHLQTDVPVGDMTSVMVYMSHEHKRMWVRPKTEFEQRFEQEQN